MYWMMVRLLFLPVHNQKRLQQFPLIRTLCQQVAAFRFHPALQGWVFLPVKTPIYGKVPLWS